MGRFIIVMSHNQDTSNAIEIRYLFHFIHSYKEISLFSNPERIQLEHNCQNTGVMRALALGATRPEEEKWHN